MLLEHRFHAVEVVEVDDVDAPLGAHGDAGRDGNEGIFAGGHARPDVHGHHRTADFVMPTVVPAERQHHVVAPGKAPREANGIGGGFTAGVEDLDEIEVWHALAEQLGQARLPGCRPGTDQRPAFTHRPLDRGVDFRVVVAEQVRCKGGVVIQVLAPVPIPEATALRLDKDNGQGRLSVERHDAAGNMAGAGFQDLLGTVHLRASAVSSR